MMLPDEALYEGAPVAHVCARLHHLRARAAMQRAVAVAETIRRRKAVGLGA